MKWHDINDSNRPENMQRVVCIFMTEMHDVNCNMVVEKIICEAMYFEGTDRFIPESLSFHGCGCCSEKTDVVTHWLPRNFFDVTI